MQTSVHVHSPRLNDGIFGKWFDQIMRDEFHIEVRAIPPGSPWKNGKTERVHRSEKYEILLRVPIADSNHCGELSQKYTDHYNLSRPHQSLGGRPPMYLRTIAQKDWKEIKSYKKSSAVDGLVTAFSLAA